MNRSVIQIRWIKSTGKYGANIPLGKRGTLYVVSARRARVAAWIVRLNGIPV